MIMFSEFKFKKGCVLTVGFFSSFCHKNFSRQYTLYTKTLVSKGQNIKKLTLSGKPRLNSHQ